jgi:hypothetical protein
MVEFRGTPQFLISDRNSSLVFGLFLKTPNMQLVMVELPGFCNGSKNEKQVLQKVTTDAYLTYLNTSAL